MSRLGRSLAAAALLLAAATLSRAQEEGQSARPSMLRMGGLNVFYDAQGPMSFHAATPADVPPGAVVLPGRLTARSCQHGLAVPLTASLRATSLSGAVGDGGYKKALGVIAREHPEVKGLFDVISDVQTLSVLGLYKRSCVVVAARAWR